MTLTVLARSVQGVAGGDVFPGRGSPEHVPGTPAALSVGDVDGDGTLDVVTSHEDGETTVFLSTDSPRGPP